MTAVIMAGGKGTRISSVASDIPKPMIQICGKPVLEHQIDCLRQQGLTDIILVVGYLGRVIEDYFKDGKQFGVTIRYYRETEPLGTAGALYYLKDSLTDDFLLLNGDIIFDVDFQRLIRYHKEKDGIATIFTHPNNHPYDSAIIVTDSESRIVKWLHKEEPRTNYKNRVNSGIHLFSPKIFDCFSKPGKMDLDREILKPLIATRQLFAYDSPEYVRDMGTPERYVSVCSDFKRGLIQAKNLHNKQKAFFLDRDGTLNVEDGFVTSPEQIRLIDGVGQAVKRINESGYLAIVITNQPVIARGECSHQDLRRIHNKLETLLGREGAYLDDIYYCPHHPDKGFPGERVEYKINCDCRKPKPGLILKAGRDYNIDLTASYMVGNGIADIQAGQSAGCQVAKIGLPEQSLPNVMAFSGLQECVKAILG
ncbi:HAD-IIIA family hydrolase [Caproicibacter fermentans]|uniref:HAD-IIIA family hydrolase n=1 Tax=Caproicibacter fermentans TaxID=2576756 RepID=A0A7G8TFN5_9FIRM|nr:HAD-IIIA family hydrolase [Caproicibacter fermentans]QNK42426.1 HAD-IIIA family hydrolase [Caproicibacter fermentans]